MILTIIIGLVIEVSYSPRLDYTENNQLILWYGRNSKRKFKILIDNY